MSWWWATNQYAFLFIQPSSLDKVSLNSAPVDVAAQYQFGNNRTIRNLQFVDNVAYFRGSHILKFGVKRPVSEGDRQPRLGRRYQCQ
jgi:hypothetical protein